MKKVIFLDRDGTIIKDKNYMYNVDDLELFSRSIEALLLLNKLGFTLIIVSNQSGVGRKYFTMEMFEKFEDHFIKQLINYGIIIDHSFYCFHTPEDKCNCRKPRTGMVENFIKTNKIDYNNSYIIGDQLSDMQFGDNLKLNKILINNNIYSQKQKSPNIFFHLADDLFNAVELIQKKH